MLQDGVLGVSHAGVLGNGGLQTGSTLGELRRDCVGVWGVLGISNSGAWWGETFLVGVSFLRWSVKPPSAASWKIF